MSDLTLSGLGGDSWEDRNDSEERQSCEVCGVSISLYELGVVVKADGVVAHRDCEVLQDQREGHREAV